MTYLQHNRKLLDEYRCGERHALKNVFDHYAPLVVSRLRGGIGYRSKQSTDTIFADNLRLELDDIVQQTFISAFNERARLSYSGTAPYLNYLLVIARNVVLMQLRKKSIEAGAIELLDDNVTDREGIVRFDDPSWELEQEELSGLVARFRDSLGGLQRQIFDARFWHKRVRPAVMEELGLTEMRLRHREQKLLDRFVKFLRRNGYLEP